MYVVYAISDPSTSKPFYVGATSDFNSRKYCHLLDSSRSDVSIKIRQLKQVGIDAKFEILVQSNRQKMFKDEKRWIDVFTKIGFELLNKKSGRPKS